MCLAGARVCAATQPSGSNFAIDPREVRPVLRRGDESEESGEGVGRDEAVEEGGPEAGEEFERDDADFVAGRWHQGRNDASAVSLVSTVAWKWAIHRESR